mmetsp:Transcript_82785/g.146233  ORF Transcript_82785/g.146233 Transcript_82785/m.146233 type:complete len:649 (+) Transcript_82785:79-2025(+)|eukprot:CAMPEP_0197650084 /NCGR_PEP_ID=MMETSP1338-20131121/30731_1 /TAXON_ID=43686 ORGANISM="Pelagodinium beii, Strain RCC1491" /NCGR_SAMPLE_ID=MMETSP1338 /ASSEMBLY_ACC=CAM_ASM_000754 /LENGTH=648 /DNA_ID=CAMNT_0043224433 /DNA_START=62 /DNA_END=2008 /DNA_ORIENTATION=-
MRTEQCHITEDYARGPDGLPEIKVKRHAGALLDDLEDMALLADATKETFPVLGISLGFQSFSGYIVKDLIGCHPTEALTRGTPEFAISRSAGHTLDDYCRTCSRADVEYVSESTLLQTGTRKDGSHYVGLSLVGLCEVQRRPYILIVQDFVAEGLSSRITASQRQRISESLRAKFLKVREHLGQARLRHLSASSFGTSESLSSSSTCFLRHERRHCNFRGHRREDTFSQLPFALPSFAFFCSRLQEHCILKDDLRTVLRREPEHLPRGSMVFSDRPVQLSQAGLQFSIRVTGATQGFAGLPMLGFTRRKPTDSFDLYPEVAKCCGASILGGADCQVYARDSYEHFRLGFQKPPTAEIEEWSSRSKEELPKLQKGDILTCAYSVEGQLQISLNAERIIDVDTRRPIDTSVEYYAIVDVCLSATSLTLISDEDAQESSPFAAQHQMTALLDLPPKMPRKTSQRLMTIPSQGELPSLPQAGLVSHWHLPASSDKSEESEEEELEEDADEEIAESPDGMSSATNSCSSPDPQDRTLSGYSSMSDWEYPKPAASVSSWPGDRPAADVTEVVPDPPLQCDLEPQPRCATHDLPWLLEYQPEDNPKAAELLSMDTKKASAVAELISSRSYRHRFGVLTALLVASFCYITLERRRK